VDKYDWIQVDEITHCDIGMSRMIEKAYLLLLFIVSIVYDSHSYLALSRSFELGAPLLGGSWITRAGEHALSLSRQAPSLAGRSLFGVGEIHFGRDSLAGQLICFW